MPAPIMPAPSSPTLVGWKRAAVPGRDWPLLMAFMLKKKVLIMARALTPVISLAKYRLSMRSAVGRSTCRPSTMHDKMASGAG